MHVIFCTGYEPAVTKMADLISLIRVLCCCGLASHNSKVPCPYCEIRGVWSPFHSHVYFRTRLEVIVSSENAQNSLQISSCDDPTKLTEIYDPSDPPMRTEDEIEIALFDLNDDSPLSTNEKEMLSRESGLKKRTVPLAIHSVVPYISFPPGIMHKFMNICHDLISIFKGSCIHLASEILDGRDELVFSLTQRRMIDKEIDSIKNGTSASVFPDVPRNCTYGARWKAGECLEFITNYTLIVFEGHLPKKYMKNIHTLSVIIGLFRRLDLSKSDVERLKELGVEFVRGYEDLCHRNNPRRVGVCKSTIHGMVHLGWAVEQCGPPIYYSRFWVERYIGDIESQPHATKLSAESLNETRNLQYW